MPGIHRVIDAVPAREAICPPRCAFRVPLHKAQEPDRPAQRRGQEIRLRPQRPFLGIYLGIGQRDLNHPDFAEIRAADWVIGGVEVEGECMQPS